MSGSACVLIPAFDPNEGLVELVSAIRERGLGVLVVDDGSKAACAGVFDALCAADVEVVHHARNKGKGAALKTGIRLLAERGVRTVVTADADGQHLPDDIAAVAARADVCPGSLILGVRDTKEMPARSKAGNTITRAITGFVCNVKVSDTQTGLRGFTLDGDRAQRLCSLSGTGYEFEMDMLVKSRSLFEGIEEVPIATVYEPYNPTSHFNAVRDSFRVYRVLLGKLPAFMLVSLASFAIDYLLFAIFDVGLGLTAFASTILARLLSATFNYTMNRFAAFRVKGKEYTPLRYIMLAAGILAVNSSLMWLLSDTLGLPALAVKIPIEIACYLISFFVQSNLAARDEDI